jgi:hypothetical protein
MAELRYRGREIGEEDILSIRALIEQYPKESRRKLSVRVCEAWQWRQANGALRDMVRRGMLLSGCLPVCFSCDRRALAVAGPRGAERR